MEKLHVGNKPGESRAHVLKKKQSKCVSRTGQCGNVKINFLGTCGGLEPISGFRHTSFTLEHAGKLFIFDSGEGSSYTAHVTGIDLLSTRAVFISHCHMDHVAGLGGLLLNIETINRKSGCNSSPMEGKTIDVYIPDGDSWAGILKTLRAAGTRFDISFRVKQLFPEDGKIFDDDGLSVHAIHNNHLARGKDGRWRSFSYRIEAGDKSVVYSGDVADIREVSPVIKNCDLLLMENAHHAFENICEYIKENEPGVKSLGFIHHGYSYILSPEGALKKARGILGDKVFFAEDGMEIEL